MVAGMTFAMRMTTALTLSLSLAACVASPVERAGDFEACRAVLDAQNQAWNAGDLEAFVAGYGGEPVFASADGVRVGMGELLARYQQRYPDRAAMGSLTFGELQFDDLGDDHVLVQGTWQLEREVGPIGGRYVLVMREIDGDWKVVLDYTTSDPAIGKPASEVPTADASPAPANIGDAS